LEGVLPSFLNNRNSGGKHRMLLSAQSAQQIAYEISSIVKQHVNIMDENGYIIASTDPKRIGDFHAGANY
jgi:sugar diacid utilization regulator